MPMYMRATTRLAALCRGRYLPLAVAMATVPLLCLQFLSEIRGRPAGVQRTSAAAPDGSELSVYVPQTRFPDPDDPSASAPSRDEETLSCEGLRSRRAVGSVPLAFFTLFDPSTNEATRSLYCSMATVLVRSLQATNAGAPVFVLHTVPVDDVLRGCPSLARALRHGGDPMSCFERVPPLPWPETAKKPRYDNWLRAWTKLWVLGYDVAHVAVFLDADQVVVGPLDALVAAVRMDPTGGTGRYLALAVAMTAVSLLCLQLLSEIRGRPAGVQRTSAAAPDGSELSVYVPQTRFPDPDDPNASTPSRDEETLSCEGLRSRRAVGSVPLAFFTLFDPSTNEATRSLYCSMATVMVRSLQATNRGAPVFVLHTVPVDDVLRGCPSLARALRLGGDPMSCFERVPVLPWPDTKNPKYENWLRAWTKLWVLGYDVARVAVHVDADQVVLGPLDSLVDPVRMDPTGGTLIGSPETYPEAFHEPCPKASESLQPDSGSLAGIDRATFHRINSGLVAFRPSRLLFYVSKLDPHP
eukprot:m51a1_g11140 hypothetical protein (526) ;mRNA; f:193290-198398